MAMYTNVLYISCISCLLDEGSEKVETCSRLTVRHINVTRHCAGLTELYRVKTARSLTSDAKHGFLEHEEGAKTDEARAFLRVPTAL